MPANDWLVGGGTQPDVRGFITWVYALKVVKQPMTVERTKPFWLGHLHDIDFYQLFFSCYRRENDFRCHVLLCHQDIPL